MYRLLIVDDEEIEREGMAQFIPWERHEIELAGTAWNGIEALDFIKKERVDIVLTDIKMPVMNGIELIREAKKVYADMEFIVLSGYGEYEYTSQAMEEGVRHYILKPCDETKVVQIIEKVKEEIQGKRAQAAVEENYRTTVRRLFPRAKEQVFHNLLLGREQMSEDYRLFLKEMDDAKRSVMVLAVRSPKEMDALDQFIIGNILGELLGEQQILMSTFIHSDVLFLLDAGCRNEVKSAVEKTKTEFSKIKTAEFSAALSGEETLACVDRLYLQIQELFRIGDTEKDLDFLHYDMFKEQRSQADLLVNYHQLSNAENFSEILFECYLAFLKMILKKYSVHQIEEVFSWVERLLYGDKTRENKLEKEDEKAEETEAIVNDSSWRVLESIVWRIAGHKGGACGKEELRMRNILLAVYRNMSNPELSIHYLSKNVLFMNEDYFGRVFLKHQKKKFSTFLLEQRIELAKQLIQYEPETKISEIASLVGYAPDGQYFSKTFKKAAGVSPSEYKDINRR